MAISLSVTVRNSALDDAFRPTNIYLQIPNQVGSPSDLWQPALFLEASNGTISLATPVQFAVPSQGSEAPTIINRVDIVTVSGGSASSNSIVARINLEDDEIETFEENGVYVIDEIHITLE
jgi:hypothetical protein